MRYHAFESKLTEDALREKVAQVPDATWSNLLVLDRTCADLRERRLRIVRRPKRLASRSGYFCGTIAPNEYGTLIEGSFCLSRHGRLPEGLLLAGVLLLTLVVSVRAGVGAGITWGVLSALLLGVVYLFVMCNETQSQREIHAFILEVLEAVELE